MKWVRISIETSIESEDAISELLMEMGSGGAQIEGDILHPDNVTLSTYFPPDDMIGERVSKINKMLKNLRELDINVGPGRVTVKQIDESVWTEPWKEFFKPISIGKRIIVYPSWEDVSESASRDILIQIDPQMAFGTGRHSTTILCMELLEDTLKGGEKIADVGTGSGILAIAAIKLGADHITAIDIDEKAIPIAKDNALLNGIDHGIDVTCSDSLAKIGGTYDVIVSNIANNVIISMIPDFKDCLYDNGILVLSGFLRSEASEMKKALESNGLTILDTRCHEEWAAIMAE